MPTGMLFFLHIIMLRCRVPPQSFLISKFLKSQNGEQAYGAIYLFFNSKSERQLSRDTSMPQRTIHDRKVKSPDKIKKIYGKVKIFPLNPLTQRVSK